jgi:hypothetical protein
MPAINQYPQNKNPFPFPALRRAGRNGRTLSDAPETDWGLVSAESAIRLFPI